MKKKLITFAIIFILGAVAAGFVMNKLAQKRSDTAMNMLASQQERLFELATTVDTGVAGAESVVTDCDTEDRYRFDELLSSLSTLDQSGLLELKALYGNCAYYYATVSNVGVSELSQAVDTYGGLLSLARTYDRSVAKPDDVIPNWEQLVEFETERSALRTELVSIQLAIVDLLLAFNSISSPAVTELVGRAQEVRENMFFLDQQIDPLRESLVHSE